MSFFFNWGKERHQLSKLFEKITKENVVASTGTDNNLVTVLGWMDGHVNSQCLINCISG